MKIKGILAGIWILVMVPSMAYGLFFDKETSTGNTFSATTLDTQITPESDPVKLDIAYEEPYPTTSFILENTGQLNTQNIVTIADISNPTFTSLINVEVKLDDTTVIYTGRLDLLSINPSYITQTPSQMNKLCFKFSISETDYNATAGETVTFKIANHAWQTTLTYGTGFSDEEHMEITITNPLPVERSLSLFSTDESDLNILSTLLQDAQ